jgi:hypothetical protein
VDLRPGWSPDIIARLAEALIGHQPEPAVLAALVSLWAKADKRRKRKLQRAKAEPEASSEVKQHISEALKR